MTTDGIVGQKFEYGAVAFFDLHGGLRLALLGVALGLLGALALTRALQAALYRVSAADPVTFAAVSVLLLVVATLAAWVPARRATRMDPMAPLRAE